jgi:Nucleotidyl transferase AbiEii toxin, Type IV TA system
MSLRAAEIIRLTSRLASRDRQLAAAIRGGYALSEPSALERALVDAAACLGREGIRHALIGGLAVAVHTGLPRATEDVDLAVRSDADRERVVALLVAAGFTLGGRFAHSINLVHAQGEPVQLAFDAGFDAAIDRAETYTVASIPIRIVRREDLIALKERAAADPGRRRSKALRDRSDVEMLRGDVPGPDEGW